MGEVLREIGLEHDINIRAGLTQEEMKKVAKFGFLSNW